jgi:hypothetical protein
MRLIVTLGVSTAFFLAGAAGHPRLIAYAFHDRRAPSGRGYPTRRRQSPATGGLSAEVTEFGTTRDMSCCLKTLEPGGRAQREERRTAICVGSVHMLRRSPDWR